jgi:hypothetical protein
VFWRIRKHSIAPHPLPFSQRERGKKISLTPALSQRERGKLGAEGDNLDELGAKGVGQVALGRAEDGRRETGRLDGRQGREHGALAAVEGGKFAEDEDVGHGGIWVPTLERGNQLDAGASEPVELLF